MKFYLNRRAVLRGIGAGLALPVLECMLDRRGLLLRDGHAAGVKMPVRYLGYFVQNGAPEGIRSPVYDKANNWMLNTGLSPLQNLKADVIQYTGLHCYGLENDFHHTDGQKGFWTGYPKHYTPKGKDVSDSFGSSISVDNLLGQKLGTGKTAFPSILASLPRWRGDRYENGSGKCSYLADSKPQTYETSPAQLAKKLFAQVKTSSADTTPAQDPRQLTVLDYLLDDSKRLAARLSASDRRRLDQHLTAVREIEQSLPQTKNLCALPSGSFPENLGDNPRLIDEQCMTLMAKLIVFAFQCDLTRYALFEVANIPPPVDYPPELSGTNVGADMWDHFVSHNMDGRVGDSDKAHVDVYNRKMKYWCLFLDAMKSSSEGDNNILYNSVSLVGTDVAIGNAHNFDNLPLFTVGQAGGALKTGRHLNFPNTTFNNLHATLLTAVGLPTTKFGVDGTGILPGVLA